jgi:hypothetical protein
MSVEQKKKKNKKTNKKKKNKKKKHNSLRKTILLKWKLLFIYLGLNIIGILEVVNN